MNNNNQDKRTGEERYDYPSPNNSSSLHQVQRRVFKSRTEFDNVTIYIARKLTRVLRR